VKEKKHISLIEVRELIKSDNEINEMQKKILDFVDEVYRKRKLENWKALKEELSEIVADPEVLDNILDVLPESKDELRLLGKFSPEEEDKIMEILSNYLKT